MNRRAVLLIIAGAIALTLAVSGSAAAVDCSDDGIHAEIAGDELENGTTVYTGTTIEVTACENNETTELTAEDVSGVEEVSVDDDDVYTLEFTGEESEVDLTDLADTGSDDSLVVFVRTTETDASLDTEDLDSALAELNETTAAIQAGNASLEDGEGAIESVEDEYKNMSDARNTMSTALVENGTAGGSAGVFTTLAQLDDDYGEISEKTQNAVEAYHETIKHEQSDARSTVQLFVGGPLVGGLVVGLVAGTAVPLLAARRVEQKMKLSRNVNYDRKSVLVPMVIGLLLAIVGVAVLILTEPELLEVIR
ncbi:hypothetical protein ACYJ1Y_11150 [Natrialbaceae archaeon A-gly3]